MLIDNRLPVKSPASLPNMPKSCLLVADCLIRRIPMEVVYAHEEQPKPAKQSLFLAGPSPRNPGDPNWRPRALTLLAERFKGTVFVPLPRNGQWLPDYDAQIEWELRHLTSASVIAFWIPRDLKTLPGFTTNVEFGMYLKSGKIVLGSPPETPKMRYLESVARGNGVPVYHTLENTLCGALALLTTLHICRD